MTEAYYPATNYQSPEIPYYSVIVDRRRLSGPALLRFFQIMKKWEVDEKDARLLLGGITKRRFQKL